MSRRAGEAAGGLACCEWPPRSAPALSAAWPRSRRATRHEAPRREGRCSPSACPLAAHAPRRALRCSHPAHRRPYRHERGRRRASACCRGTWVLRRETKGVTGETRSAHKADSVLYLVTFVTIDGDGLV
eukprot:scaffold95487_cov37-Phaeocystis_antarctica.AAC.2